MLTVTIDDVMKFGNDDVRNFAAGVYKDIGQLFKHVAEMLKKTFGWSNLSVNRLDRIVENMKHLIASKDEGDRAVGQGGGGGRGAAAQ